MTDRIKFNVGNELEGHNDLDLSVEDTETVTVPEKELDVETPEYATNPVYNEIREAIIDTNWRLFLINNTIGIVGTVDKDIENKIQFLTCDVSGENFHLVDAPEKFEQLKSFPTLLNKPEDSEYPTVDYKTIIEFITQEKEDEVPDEDDDEVPEPDDAPEEGGRRFR